MVTVANGLSARGHHVDLLTAQAAGPLLAEVGQGVELHDLRARGVMAAVPRLTAYLRRRRPAALLATLDHSNVAAVLARHLAGPGVATRVFVRVAADLDVIGSGRLRHRLLRAAVRLAYARSAGVIAVSDGVAADVRARAGVPERLLHTIYNPVVDDDFDRRAAEPVRHPWLERPDQPVVVGMGRLEPQKDFATLLRAVAAARARRELRLIVLGEGSLRAELEALARELGIADAVDMPGFVPNPLPFLRCASVFVLSSRFEGLPGALIQAMAAGCPVVSTDCPSGPAEVLEGGRHGPLVPVGDAPRMAEALLATLERPRSGTELRRAVERFAADTSLAAYERLLLGPD